MQGLPATVQQLIVLLVLLLPGVVYQEARERFAGRLPAEQEPQNRLLRAVGAGALLDACYAVLAGPALVDLLRGTGPGLLSGLAERPRAVGVVGLLLVVVIPAALARGEVALVRRRARARHDPLPTAWDALFQDRGPCFVRIRTRSGLWIGGFYGSRSFASAYPEARDLYLQQQYRMAADGTFGPPVARSAGIYVQCGEVEVLEILERAATTQQDRGGSRAGAA